MFPAFATATVGLWRCGSTREQPEIRTKSTACRGINIEHRRKRSGQKNNRTRTDKTTQTREHESGQEIELVPVIMHLPQLASTPSGALLDTFQDRRWKGAVTGLRNLALGGRCGRFGLRSIGRLGFRGSSID